MNTKNILIILVVVAVLLLGGALLFFVRSGMPPNNNETLQVRELVTQFGLRLKSVSLQGPEDQLKQAITDYYGNSVSPQLLQAWVNNPTTAPGRLTSSPWPDRITIGSIIASENNTYTVTGNIVEVAKSTENIETTVSEIPVTIVVGKVENAWRITSFSQDRNQANFTQQGIITTNNPGQKPDVWYLVYEQPGKPVLTRELDFSSTTMTETYLYNGQTVRVEGQENNNIVRVFTIEVINATKADLIWVASPMPNQLVTSPLTITGRARGNWYFEASFPVKLLDANGNVLVQAPAQAQGEWMTTNYVPFTITLTFAKPTTATGTLVLEKDNPSGLPQHANELRIPVKFQ